MKIKITPIIVWLSVCVAPAYAQRPVLEGYIQQGIESNLQLKQEQLQYERSVEQLAQARALFLPYIAANASYTLADGGRKIQIPIGDLLNPIYSTLNQLTGSDNFPQIGNVSEQFLPNNFHETKLRVIQPLFNPEIYFNYKAQKELLSVQQAQKNAYENELKFAIASAYYQYLQSEDAIIIFQKTQALLEELVHFNQKLVANERATKDLVLNAQYELSAIEGQQAQAQRDNQVAKAYFNFLLNRDLSSDIVKDTAFVSSFTRYDIGKLTTSALTNRSEIKQVQSGLEASEKIIGMSRSKALLPTVNAVGDIGYQGYKYNFNADQQYWLLQFSLSWDIFKGGERRSKIQQAKLDYSVTENKLQQLQKQIELQVIQQYNELEAAQKSWTTTTTGVKRAEGAFQIIRAKYNEGQALLIEYLDAQNKMTTAQLQQSIATYELLRKEASLQKTIANL
jgi:outer membrane protein